MKKFLIRGIIIVASVLACNFAAAKPLTDVPYDFDRQKLEVAEDSFHFLRSFVDYFYKLAKANRGHFKMIDDGWKFSAWCVGDAHPENFGAVLLKDGSSIFTMNDMDDSGPGPAVLDLVRLMVSSRLYDPETDVGKILDAYREGLQAEKFKTPDVVDSMLEESREKGTTPHPHKIDGNQFKREAQMKDDLPPAIRETIKEALTKGNLTLDPDFQILDLVETSKVGGGSGGLLRYEVLIRNKGSLLHLELKEEVKPAISPVATSAIPQTESRIRTTVQMEMGIGASPFYSVVNIDGKSMLVRPRFAGNDGVSLDKQKRKENAELIRYEAYQLGVIHSRSLPSTKAWVKWIKNVSNKAMESDVEDFTKLFETKFKKLKH